MKCIVELDGLTSAEVNTDDIQVGDFVTGTQPDENGNPREVSGRVTEILEFLDF